MIFSCLILLNLVNTIFKENSKSSAEMGSFEYYSLELRTEKKLSWAIFSSLITLSGRNFFHKNFMVFEETIFLACYAKSQFASEAFNG